MFLEISKKLLLTVASVLFALALACPACFVAAADTAVEPGSYMAEVSLSGGSGRASVASPAQIEVDSSGMMTATVVWSSTNYDLMVVDGVDYVPTTLEGGSTFEIPVAALDTQLPVQAETTAMSEPHMIDYTLYFDSSTLTEMKSEGNPMNMATAAIIALVAIVLIVALGLYLRKRSGGKC